MEHILTIQRGVNVIPLALQLKQNPHLWGEHPERTQNPDSPHAQVSDIWARFGPQGIDRNAEHDSIWYPAYRALPAIRDIVFPLMHMLKGERLGGVLITKIPPGGRVLPHADTGWHAGYYEKFGVQIESHQQQAFCYDDGQHITAPGDVFWFRNSRPHWVINDSPVDRITMIVCIRSDQQQPLGG